MASECSPACMRSTAPRDRCECRCGGKSHGCQSGLVPSASEDGTIVAGRPPGRDTRTLDPDVNRVREEHARAVEAAERECREQTEHAERTRLEARQAAQEGWKAAHARASGEHPGDEQARLRALRPVLDEYEDAVQRADEDRDRATDAAKAARADAIHRADQEYLEAMDAISSRGADAGARDRREAYLALDEDGRGVMFDAETFDDAQQTAAGIGVESAHTVRLFSYAGECPDPDRHSEDCDRDFRDLREYEGRHWEPEGEIEGDDILL